MNLETITQNYQGVCYDYKRCQKNYIYCAIEIYTQLDGREITHGDDFIEKAINAGATLIVARPQAKYIEGVEYLICDNPREQLALLAKKFYGQNNCLNTIGVIGTNGKTSISYLLYMLLNQNFVTGYLGTIGAKIGINDYPSKDTTPEPVDLWSYRQALIAKEGIYSVMEVSSHGISFNRVKGIDFNHLIFTNITPDHLDYHKTFENYLKTKMLPFSEMSEKSFAHINIDTEYASSFIEASKGIVRTYGTCEQADVRACDIEFSRHGINFYLHFKNEKIFIQTEFIGRYNLENILAVSSVALELGFSLKELQVFWSLKNNIPGRMEQFNLLNGGQVFVDYAHTPDAFSKVLPLLKKICMGKLWVVFGCGGDRDKSKRPIMGKIASEYGDEIIVTADNCRSEFFTDIAKDIVSGIKNNPHVLQMESRKEAIEYALSQISGNDFLVILGKGHETTQIIGENVLFFSDQKTVQDWIGAKDYSHHASKSLNF